jgi:hypothetical protein
MGGRGQLYRYDPGLLRGVLTSDYKPKPRHPCCPIALTPFGVLHLGIYTLLNDEYISADIAA